MHIVKDKNGNFKYYKQYKKLKTLDGKTVYIIGLSKTSAKDCKTKFNRKLTEFYQQQKELDVILPSEHQLLKYYALDWYNLYIGNADISKSTKDGYKSVINTHIIVHLGDIPLSKLTEDDCQKFINLYSGYSKGHVKKLRQVLKRMLQKAVNKGYIQTNPADDLSYPYVIENKRRAITDNERHCLITVSLNHEYGIMPLTLLLCGLRPIEFRKMKWDWIDFKNKTITVKYSKTKSGEGRIVPIPTLLIGELEKSFNKSTGIYVIPEFDSADTELSPSSQYKIWHSIVDEMRNISKEEIAADFTPYLLRHTFCTDCQAAEVPINVAKEFMGHADISVTANIYTHTNDEVFEINRQRLYDYYDKFDQS